jgi:hypothetical protein
VPRHFAREGRYARPDPDQGGARIVRLDRPLNGARSQPDTWRVCDRTRAVNEYIATDDLPIAVLREIGTAHTAYFHAVRDADGRLIFGRMAGGQTW